MKLETHTPFQRAGAKRSRALVSIRTGGLIVALVVVLATVSSLGDRKSVDDVRADTPAGAPREGGLREPGGAVQTLLSPPPPPSQPSPSTATPTMSPAAPPLKESGPSLRGSQGTTPIAPAPL
jgi:hypothetical protein